MAAKPLTSEAIALTEKKMDMALDDIIKLSKNGSKKNKKQQRVYNKSQGVFKGNAGQRNAYKVRRYLDSRSSIRQGALAQRRSNSWGNKFPITTEVAKKAAAAPIRNRFFNNNSRMINKNQNRVGGPPIQRKAFGRENFVKEQAKLVTKQKPSTLDARFADLREQRIKSFSAQNNSRRVGGSQQQFQFGRNQFGKQ